MQTILQHLQHLQSSLAYKSRMALATVPAMANSDPALCTQLVDVICEEVQYCVK